MLETQRSQSGASRSAGSLALATIALGACAGPPRDEVWALAEDATAGGDWAVAAELWNETIYTDGPDSPRPFRETARAMWKLDEPNSAIAILGQGLRYHPESKELHAARGALLAELGYRRAAEVDLERALELDPDQRTVWRQLGEVRLALDLPKKAIPALEEAVRLGAGCDAWRCLARAHRDAGDPREACEWWQRVLAEEDGASLEDLAEAAALHADPALLEEGTDEAAAAAARVRAALEIEPQFAQGWFVCGLLAEATGEPELAIETYRRAIEVDNLHLEAATNLALLHARRGEHEQALDMLTRALELERDPGRRRTLRDLARDCEAAHAALEETAPVEDVGQSGDEAGSGEPDEGNG